MTGVLSVDGVVRRGALDIELRAEVQPGEVLGVLGPNGAGKTTLLRAVAGLEPLQRGRIELAGRLLDDAGQVFVPPEQRRAGLVFQDYRLFPHLTVADNVAFALRSQGVGRRAARERARHWLGHVDLADLADRRPAQLSGGQAQRVALARALAMEPDVMLLDEPLAALDVRTRLDVRLALRKHIAGFAGPVVVVTHDAVEAMVLADRLLVVEEGRVVQAGLPADVARRPATDYVARLVGVNLLAGRALADGSVALDGGGELRGAAGGTAGGDSGERVVGQRLLVTVPPSAVSLHAEHPVPGSARNVWQGVVDGLEPLQDRVRVHVDARPAVLVDVTPAAVAELHLHPGQPVWLSVKATEVEVYADPAA